MPWQDELKQMEHMGLGASPAVQVAYLVGREARRPEIPVGADHVVASLACACWDQYPEERPDCELIVVKLMARAVELGYALPYTGAEAAQPEPEP